MYEEEEEEDTQNIVSFPPMILPYALFHMPPATSRPGSW